MVTNPLQKTVSKSVKSLFSTIYLIGTLWNPQNEYVMIKNCLYCDPVQQRV